MGQRYNSENIGLGVAAVKLSGTVEMIVPRAFSAECERVQIRVQRGDDICGVIRISNTLYDVLGKPVALKNGAEVNITITSNMPPAVKTDLSADITESDGITLRDAKDCFTNSSVIIKRREHSRFGRGRPIVRCSAYGGSFPGCLPSTLARSSVSVSHLSGNC
jgi:hypothetical protein